MVSPLPSSRKRSAETSMEAISVISTMGASEGDDTGMVPEDVGLGVASGVSGVLLGVSGVVELSGFGV